MRPSMYKLSGVSTCHSVRDSDLAPAPNPKGRAKQERREPILTHQRPLTADSEVSHWTPLCCLHILCGAYIERQRLLSLRQRLCVAGPCSSQHGGHLCLQASLRGELGCQRSCAIRAGNILRP